MDEKSASEQIDDIIKNLSGWRGETLAKLRSIITSADPKAIEEVKWKKPSKPEGVSVWSDGGIICIGEALKNAVRLTFPKGAQTKDAHKLFNTRLDGNAVRAIDFLETDKVDEAALRDLIVEAAAVVR